MSPLQDVNLGRQSSKAFALNFFIAEPLPGSPTHSGGGASFCQSNLEMTSQIHPGACLLTDFKHHQLGNGDQLSIVDTGKGESLDLEEGRSMRYHLRITLIPKDPNHLCDLVITGEGAVSVNKQMEFQLKFKLQSTKQEL